MDTQAQHLMADIWLKEPLTREMVDRLTAVVDERLTVVQRTEKKFEPQGETIVYILAESHFSLHTYPEHQYVTLDIYICSLDIDLDEILSVFKEALPIEKIHQKVIHRGFKDANSENPFEIKDQKKN